METAQKGFRSACDTPARDCANQRRVLGWAFAWAVTFLAATAVIKFEWIESVALDLVAAGVSTLVGVGMVWAYRCFLRETDELRRKIELDALALAVGVGLVGGFAYSLFHRVLAAGEPDLLNITALMMLTYCVGNLLGRRRYA